MASELEQVLSGERRWCVICADCLPTMAAMPDGCVDHVITDPPYDARTHRNAFTARMSAVAAASQLSEVCGVDFDATDPETLAPELLRLSRRWALTFCSIEDMGRYRDGAGKAWTRAGIWRKIAPAPQITGDRPGQAVEGIAIMHRRGHGRSRWNGGGLPGIWDAMAPRGGLRPDHPTPKPLTLMLELVSLFTDPDDLILDPFCGSGSTLCAALRLGRRAIGIEREPKWAELSRERCEAEVEGSTLQARRAGQVPMFGGDDGRL